MKHLTKSEVHRRRVPLYVRVLLGAALGATFGVLFGQETILFNLTNDDLGQLGLLVIRLLKLLALPLIIFAIVDAFLRTHITARQGGRLIAIALINVSVAFTIGLTIMNLLKPGEQWRGKVEEMSEAVSAGTNSPASKVTGVLASSGATLSPLKNFVSYVPENLVEPFWRNNLITIILGSVLFGAALRTVRDRELAAGRSAAFASIEHSVGAIYQTLVLLLEWVVLVVPFAVFGVLAQVVGRSGLSVFTSLVVFLSVILLGLAIHSLIYYPLVAWLVGRRPPRVFFGKGADAILTALSTNSSLATVPITLRCLTQKMGISDASARLSACIGTNLNNDGITLYEAMAALFLAQAFGLDLSLSSQIVIVLASLMAGIGIAGIPEAGLIVLPLVLGAAGLPEWFILTAIPLVLPVDWIIARARSAVNVMSDMLVAILLDRFASDASVSTMEPHRVESAVTETGASGDWRPRD